MRRAFTLLLCTAGILAPTIVHQADAAQDDPSVVCSPAWVRAGRASDSPAGAAWLEEGPGRLLHGLSSEEGNPSTRGRGASAALARPQVIVPARPPVPPPDPFTDLLPAVESPPTLGLALTPDEVGASSDSCQSIPPSDTYFNIYQRTSMLEIGAPDAWSISYGGPEVSIAFIGTGIYVANPDLSNKLWRNPGEAANGGDDDGNGYVDDTAGWNFAERNGDINDENGGADTMYAGIAAADTNNNDGVAGISWFGRIMVLKALAWRQYQDESGKPFFGFGGKAEDITEAICYAANQGARVIHLNAILLDGQIPSADIDRMRKAIEYAYAHGNGAVVVAPAGDCGSSPCVRGGDVNPTILPAAFNRVVGAQAYEDGRLPRANASTGFWVDIAAPGRGLGFTYHDPRDPSRRDFLRMPTSWQALSGFASAQVAGVAAVLLSANPAMRPLDVERAICRSADRSKGGPYGDLSNDPVDPQPRNDTFGCGALSMEHAIERMPWQVRAVPESITVLTDGKRSFISQTIVSQNLNDCAWKLTASETWVDVSAPRQAKGFQSKSQVSANWERLIEKIGGRGPQAGDRYTATLSACPDNSDQANWPGPWGDGCRRIPLTLQIIDEFFDLYLPISQLNSG